jgi:hypothetical protein
MAISFVHKNPHHVQALYKSGTFGLSHKRPIRFNRVFEIALKLLNPLVLLNHLSVRFLGELG